MLYSIDDKLNQITSVPHAADYRAWTDKLSHAQLKAIKDELFSRIEGGEVLTSSWIPGADWGGTPFESIYTTACRYDEEAAAMCFGLILWEVMMEHPDAWSFGRFEKGGVSIKGLTYFRIQI